MERGESSTDCGTLRVGHRLGFPFKNRRIEEKARPSMISKVPPYERQPEEGLQMYMQVHSRDPP